MGLVALVRHADAGSRAEWDDDDDTLRPLTRKGIRQAEALAGALRTIEFTRLGSSSYLRCVQTFEPLGAALGLRIGLEPALAEGAPREATLTLIGAAGADGPVALCSHGDVIGGVCELLVERGLVDPDGVELRKGSTWLLRVEDGEIAAARYLPPPRV